MRNAYKCGLRVKKKTRWRDLNKSIKASLNHIKGLINTFSVVAMNQGQQTPTVSKLKLTSFNNKLVIA